MSNPILTYIVFAVLALSIGLSAYSRGMNEGFLRGVEQSTRLMEAWTK